jgi:hypothetical protein
MAAQDISFGKNGDIASRWNFLPPRTLQVFVHLVLDSLPKKRIGGLDASGWKETSPLRLRPMKRYEDCRRHHCGEPGIHLGGRLDR